MKRLLTLFAFASSLAAQFSYDLNVVASATMGSTLTGSMWVDYDLHSKNNADFTAPSQVIDVTEVNNTSFMFRVQWNTSNQIAMQSFRDSCDPSNEVFVSLASKRAIGVRISRNRISGTEGSVTWEVWDKEGNPDGFGAYYTVTRSCTTMSGLGFSSIRFGEATTHNMALNAFWLHLGTPPASGALPPHAISHPTTAVSLSFDAQNGTEANGKTTNFTGATYTATPVYEPACDAGTSTTYRAGKPVDLDGSNSWANDVDAGTLTYSWATTAKPAAAQLWWTTGRAVAQPSITGAIANIGEDDPMYSFDLTVTQANGQSRTCNVSHGVVATDDNFVVVTGSPGVDYILGPMIMFGKAAWPGLDTQHLAQAAYDRERLVNGDWSDDQPLWTTPSAGTITVTNGSSQFIGTDTTFQSTFCGGGSTIANGTARYVVIHVEDPDTTTSDILNVPFILITASAGSACPNNTTLNATSAWSSSMKDCPTGCTVTYTSTFSGSVSGAWSGLFTNTFYDAAAAHYALYRRSGFRAYRDNYRDLVGKQITVPNWNYGYHAIQQFQANPRNRNMNGVFLRLIEDPNAATNHWDTYVNRYCARMRSNVINNNFQYQCCDREHGFEIKDLSMCAQFDSLGTRSQYQDAIVHYLESTAGIGTGFIPNKNRNLNPAMTDSTGDVWDVINEALIPDTTRVSITAGDATVTRSAGTGLDAIGHEAGMYVTFCKGSRTNYADCDNRAYTATITNANELELDKVWAVPPGWTCPGGTCTDLHILRGHLETAQQFIGYATQPFMMSMIGKSFYQYVAPALRLDNYSATHNCTDEGVSAPCDEVVENLADGANTFLREKGFVASGGMYYSRDHIVAVDHPDDPGLIQHNFYNTGLPLGQWSRAAGTITNFVDSGTVGTVNLTVNHGLAAGNAVWMTGASDEDANGFYVVQTTPTAQSFTVTTSNVTDATYTTAAMAISTAVNPSNLEARSRPQGVIQAINSNITQTFEGVSSLAFQYFKTGDATLKTWFDHQMDIAMHPWGLPEGHVLTTPAINYALDLGVFGNNASKTLGMLAGTGAAYQWAAVYAGLNQWPRTPVPVNREFNARIADVATATKVRFTVWDPNGNQVDQDTCTSMPCTLTLPDSQMGGHMVKMDYLNASDVIVRSSEVQPILNY